MSFFEKTLCGSGSMVFVGLLRSLQKITGPLVSMKPEYFHTCSLHLP